MIKRIALLFAGFAVLAAFPSTVAAESVKPIAVKPIVYPVPIPKPIPIPIWRNFETKPGHPVHLKGCGLLQAKGKGLLKYTNTKGYIYVAGKGMLGVERSDISKVKVKGFRRVTQVGRWVIFIGRGTAKAQGADLDLFFHGKGKTYARGCGKVSFWGKWTGRYIRLFRVKPIPLPIELNFLSSLAR